MKKNILGILLVASLTTVTSLRAQNYIDLQPLFQMLSTQYGLHPEVLIMDPVYDSDHKVTGYSSVGTLQINLLPLGAEYPERKSVIQWDRFRNTYKEAVECLYEYDDQMCVTKETIRLLDRNYCKDMEELLVKRHFYEKEDHVEIIGTKLSPRYIATEMEDGPGVMVHREEDDPMEEDASPHTHANTEYRYLNESQLPDSVVYFNTWGNSTKITYEYDAAKRISATQIYHRWGKGNDYEQEFDARISYEKNKVSYTLRGAEMLRSDIDEYELEDIHSFENPALSVFLHFMYNGPLTFTYTFDKYQRMTSKEITFRDEKVVSSSYHYNSKGKQDAETCFHSSMLTYLANALIPDYPLPNMEDMQGISYTVRHNKDGFRTTEIFRQTERSSPPVKLGAITDRYSDDGKLLHHDLIRYDSDDGSFVDRELLSIQYNTSKDGIWRIEKTTYLTDEDEDAIYQSAQSYEIEEKDSSGRVIFIENMYSYDQENRSWERGKRVRKGYDENGHINFEEEMRYEGTWWGSFRQSYVKDLNDRTTYMEEFKWADGAWKPTKKYHYAYDEYGNSCLNEEYYMQSDGAWYGGSKSEQQYDNQGQLIVRITYQWQEKKWALQEKRETSYHEYGREYTYYSWQDEEWMPTEKRDRSVKDEPLNEEIDQSWIWDSLSNDWRIDKIKKSWQTDIQTSMEERYSWDSDLEKVVGSHYRATTQTDSSRINTIQAWNLTTEQWEPYLRYSKEENDQLIYTIERYNPSLSRWVNDRKIHFREETIEGIDGEQELLRGYIHNWQAKTQNWQLSYSTSFHLGSYYNRIYTAECFRHDPKTGEPAPFAYLENSDYDEIYSVWNADQNAYEPLYMGRNNTLWYPSIGEWINEGNTTDEITTDERESRLQKAYFVRDLFLYESDRYIIEPYFRDAPKHLLISSWHW